jgi:hypothetical protein
MRRFLSRLLEGPVKGRLDEAVPTRVTPALGRGFESMRKQDVLDRVARDIVAQIEESPAEPGVAPGWVFPGHLRDQLSDVLLRRSPSLATLLDPSYLAATRLRYHRSSVFGVTTVPS